MNDGKYTTVGSIQFSSGITFGSDAQFVRWDLGSYYKNGYVSVYGTVSYNVNTGATNYLYVKIGSQLGSLVSIISDAKNVNGGNTIDMPFHDISSLTGGLRYVEICAAASASDIVTPQFKEIVVMGGYA